MPFNDRTRLDPSQVQDRRGRNVGRTLAFGGGGISVVVFVVALLLGANPMELLGMVASDTSSSNQDTSEISDLQTTCQTGADANTRADCRIVGYVNSIQDYWSEEFSARDAQYVPAQTVLFSGATQAACGYASAASGPFYCPSDQMIYLDLAFFEELTSRYGAQGGPFAEAYVLAHEYGHHIQNLLGLLDQSSRDSTGPQSMAVYIELQADCLAGVWAYHAAETGYLMTPSKEEIAQSLDAASSVGDDRIQRQTQGYVSPESWTHGSSEQRQQAFIDGLESGDMNSCDNPGWTE
jgi:hypothetical protein